MKVVQIGILVALVAVGALLFMVWKGQQAPAPPEPVVQEAEAPAPAPASTPMVAEQPPVAAKPAPKPAPSRKRQTSPKPAPTVARSAPPRLPVTPPEPVSEPQPAQAEAAVAAPAEKLPPPPPRQVTLEAGTIIPVRLSETLSSDRMQTGDTFSATLDRPLVVEGFVIAERGARLEGRVVEAQQAGRVRGVAELAVQLVRLHTADGQNVELQTETFRKQGPTSKKEDAAKVGAGAGIGAAIGAIAGGGKGAAIGAAIGGAAGAGGVAATRGKPATLPVETRIDFRLNAPVTITESVH